MANFRSNPPTKLGGLDIVGVRDYQTGKRTDALGNSEPMTGPTGNVLIFETNVPGNYVAARPSGTEPKVKFYMFTYVAAEDLNDLAVSKREMDLRIDGYAEDMQKFADQA